MPHEYQLSLVDETLLLSIDGFIVFGYWRKIVRRRILAIRAPGRYRDMDIL